MRRILSRCVVAVVVLLSPGWSNAARANEVLGFDDTLAAAANGPIPGVNGVPDITAAGVCGSDTESYLSELLDTPPTQIKVIQHWGDIIPGKEMMVSGIVHDVSLGGIDLPFDHPFSGDMNFDVELDPPYQAFARHLGTGTDPDAPTAEWLHVELEVGQLLHDPALVVHGPTEGEPWDVLPSSLPQTTLNNTASIGLQPDYLPQNGDRVVVMGRWVLDCGHTDFHSELHPVTFMALGRVEGTTTVVHVLGNPYRSTQRYTPNLGGGGANSVNDTNRYGLPFPSFLVGEVLRLVTEGRDHLQAPVLLEATRPAPAQWKVCAPPGTSGRSLHIVSSFVKRPRVRTRVLLTRDDQGKFGCVRVITQAVRGYTAQDPPLRQCTLPWDWVNAEAADQAGLPPDFDLRPFIKDAIDQGVSGSSIPQADIDAAKARVDNNPTSVCFDPLAAPLPSAAPSPARRRWRRTTTRSDQPYPFYGTIEVGWGD